LTLWGNVKDREAVVTEARKFAESFELLDPTKETAPEGNLTDIRNPEWGFETQIAGSGWRPGGSSIKQNPLIRFSAQRANEALIVLPLRFDEEPPEMEALARGMLSSMNFEYPFPKGSPGSSTNKGTTGSTEELEIRTEREVDGVTFAYVMRVIRGERHAHLVAGWADKKNGDMERVTRAMDGIKLSPPEGQIPAPSAAERNALGIVLNHSGLSYFIRNKHEAAAQWFQRAFEQTKEDGTLLDNWVFALQNAGKAKEALELIEPELARFPKLFDLHTRRAYLLAELGKPEEANTSFLALIDQGLKDESELLNWATSWMKQQRYDLAEAAVVEWNKKQPSTKTRRWEAEVISAGGDTKRALQALEKLVAENPEDEQIAQTQGKLLNEAEDYTQAAAIAERILAKSPQNVEALQILGWSQMGRRWYREAKETFERAAKVYPQDEELQDAVRHASAALGQGNNSDVKTPIEAVPVPALLADELQGTRLPAGFGEGQPAVALVRSTGYHFEKDKPLRRTIRRKIKILTSAGVDLFSTMEFPFDPLGERIFLNRLEVRDEKGEVISTGSIDDSFVRDASDGISSHRKVLHVQAPGLRPGYT
ncbi:MAG: tetratricopeptide repeat protein, partial [Verrucomicrobiaceae bacterium]